MAAGSNVKRKSARSKKDSPKLCIAEWVFEQASMPGYVSFSFIVTQEAGGGAASPTPRRFLLRCERASELIKELQTVLEDSAAIQCLEEQAARGNAAFAAQPGLKLVRAGIDDTELSPNHFDLGAYGLVGN
jgi:hypothetical protein